MKKFLLVILALQITSFLSAQDLKFKKDILYVDGAECLRYDVDILTNVISFFDMNGDDLVYLKFLQDEWGADYQEIVFVKEDLRFETNVTFMKKIFIKKLIQTQGLVDCELKREGIDKFASKYGK